jgi:hypothetical protein
MMTILHRYSLQRCQGAIEIDAQERIYAHPNFANNLHDHRAFGVTTAYEVIQRGNTLFADRALFSFRDHSNDRFRSFTYKFVDA